MFADNWKISLRQIRRLLALDLFGLSSLLLPGVFSSLTGADGIFCLLLGMAGGVLLLLLIRANLKNIQDDFYRYMTGTAGQVLGDVFMVFYFLYFIGVCAFALYELVTLSLSWMLPDGSYFWVGILLLGLGAYGTVRGLEGRARVYEIIFWFLGAPLLLMLFLSLWEVNPDRWTPLACSDGWEILRGGLAFWIFLLPLISLLFLKPYCARPRKLASCGWYALIAVTVLNGFIYLILTGVFGQNAMGALPRPVLTLMGMVNLPGGFLTRQDVVMTAVWFFALFALVNTGIFQSNLILKELFRQKDSRFTLWAVLLFVFLLGKGFFEHSFLMELFADCQSRVVLPGIFLILLLLPTLHRIRNGGKKKEGEIG